MKKAALNPMAAGLSVGIAWALGLFIMTLVAASNGYAAHILEMLQGVYPYYELSTAGAFWGLLWGFLDGAIGAYILVWLYNMLVNKLG
jgi:hypothetical protein